MSLVALWSSSASAACPAGAADVRAAADRGLTAWHDWSWDVFEASAVEVRADLDCLSENLGRDVVADVHLLFALRAGRAQNAPAAVASFRALLAVEPSYAPTDQDAAPGSLLRSAYDTARASVEGSNTPLTGGGWWVDGAPANAVPTQRAAIVQRSVRGPASRYLDGLTSPVDLGALRDPAPAVAAPAERTGRPSIALAGGAAGAALASTVVFLVPARSTWRQYGSAPESELDRLESMNHASVIGGYTLAAAAAGLMAGAVIQGRW